MITLHILKLLEERGLGTLALTGSETGVDLLFFEKLPLGKTGVYIMSGGDPLTRFGRTSQSFDLYARGTNDLNGAQRLKEILRFFAKECYPACDLPTVPGYSTDQYINVIIQPTSNVQNIGVDDTDRVIYVASARVTYKEIQ